MPIDRIKVQNFKSIRDSGDISIGSINVLIGPNGAGKSNLISFFKLLNAIYRQGLKNYVAEHGYANNLLHFGRKQSAFIEGSIVFRPSPDKNTSNMYEFRLAPQISGNGFYFEKDIAGYNIWSQGTNEAWDRRDLGGEGEEESSIRDNQMQRAEYLNNYFEQFNVFHFHDTSNSSSLKQPCFIKDNRFLRYDGSNLPAILYKISAQNPKRFKLIEHTIQSIAPFFEGFQLGPDEITPNQIILQWSEKKSTAYFDATHLSDGTLRFIALTTLLLQPEPPKTIIIDEPELGLHPSAISKLGAMIRKASSTSQIIISTQSVPLLNEFEPSQIIVSDRSNNQSVFKRLEAEDLSAWIDDYSLGQLWNKNIIGGNP